MTESKNDAIVFIKINKTKLKQLGYDSRILDLIFTHKIKPLLIYEDVEYRIRQNISCLQCAGLEHT